MTLTEKEKEQLKKEGEDYKIFKADINIKLGINRREIERLERELLDSMPATPEGKAYCEVCGVKSMVYTGERKDDKGKFKLYNCEFCNEPFEDRISSFM